MTDTEMTTADDDGPHGDPNEDPHLEQAEQEAIRFTATVADSTEDAAQPEPLNATGKEAA